MKAIGEELRRAREAQDRTLEEIASATRINRTYLADLEDGRKPDIPDTYLRAFIKAYAAQVGLDGNALLRTLEQEMRSPDEERGGSTDVTASRATNSVMPVSLPPALRKGQRAKALFIIATLIILGFVISLLFLRKDQNMGNVREIAFDDVMKEWEQKKMPSGGDVGLPVDTLLPGQITPRDSLTIVGTAMDSVWVHVVADSSTSREFLLNPKGTFRLRARKQFLVTLGNAGGVSFTLNGNLIGTLGPRGKIIKNVVLGWNTLKSYTGSPPKKSHEKRQ